MRDTDYVYAVAYMKTLENKMLLKSDIEGLLCAADFSEAVKLLTDKGYGGGVCAESAEELIDGEMKMLWSEAEAVVPREAPLYILKYRNDFHNLKTVLKALITNYDFKPLLLYPAVCDPEKISEAVKTADFSGLPDFIRETARRAYEIITREHDGRSAEIYIDKMTWKIMAEEAEQNAFLSGWIKKCIVFTDILIAARAGGKSREFIENTFIACDDIPLNKLANAAGEGREALCAFIAGAGYTDGAAALSESVGALEKWCDNQRTEYLKSAKNKYFGFEPIMAFILGKEAEAQAVRIILSGKKNEIDVNIIRERLRDLYV